MNARTAALALSSLALLSGCRFIVRALDPGDAGARDLAIPPERDGGMPDLAGGAVDLAGSDGGGMVIGGGALGSVCKLGSECQSGNCIDGYCCDTLCDPAVASNLCKACNVPGAEGHCVFALAGTDPNAQCAQDPTTSCGQDGLCDGNGACRKYVAGTACGSPVCAQNHVTYAPACDGNGACVPGTGADCLPYACADATSCATSCTPPANGCAGGATCDANGSCGTLANGQPCLEGTQCTTGNCAQGVCCDKPCGATCFACNVPGTVGKCAPVPNGMDPLAQCTPSSRTTCGFDGQCDGKGACRLWAAGTPCAGASCSGDTVIPSKTCDGKGSCGPSPAVNCAPYTCNPATTSCFMRPCSSNAQCASGKSCNSANGKCQ